MEIGGVNSIYVLPEPPPSRHGHIDQEMFLRLLTVQLATQNPLEPMSDRDFFAQLAQLGTVQGVDELKRGMQMSQASSLLGKFVEVFSTFTENGVTNGLVGGIVTSVEMSNNRVYIRVDGVRYEMDRLVRILPDEVANGISDQNGDS